MKIEHRQELRRRLEQLYYMGYTVMEEWELRLWWNRERVTKNVWRDIVDTWVEVAEEEMPLHAALAGSRYVFIQPKEFKDVRKWC